MGPLPGLRFREGLIRGETGVSMRVIGATKLRKPLGPSKHPSPPILPSQGCPFIGQGSREMHDYIVPDLRLPILDDTRDFTIWLPNWVVALKQLFAEPKHFFAARLPKKVVGASYTLYTNSYIP